MFEVLVEEIIDDAENDLGIALGRGWFQAPEVDGACIISYDLDDKNAFALELMNDALAAGWDKFSASIPVADHCKKYMD